jgi:pimeloyl-ACP methyl ester carboxylesterase
MASTALTAVIAGEGPPIVLVHGSLGDYRQWMTIAERLQGGRRVISVSRRYHWPNPPAAAGAPYTYDAHVADLVDYLRTIGGRLDLAGHSYGAGIVLLAALREPVLIRRLILVEPPFGSLLPDGAAGLDDEMADRTAMMAALQQLTREGRDEEASRMLIDWTQGGPGGFAKLPEDAQAALLQNAATVGPTFSAAPPQVDCAALGALPMPTLVLNGEWTRPFYRVVGERAAACIPHATRAIIPRAGHMTIVERPEETATLMLEWLDGG